ncbi:MAG: hypothetical protein Q8O99_07330 [bacterium]|nr:hypothetical protein [bacterium]
MIPLPSLTGAGVSILTVGAESLSVIVPVQLAVPRVAFVGLLSNNLKVSAVSNALSSIVLTSTVVPVLPAGILA